MLLHPLWTHSLHCEQSMDFFADTTGVLARFLVDIRANTGDQEFGNFHVDIEPFISHAHNTWNLELCIIVDLYLYTLPTNHFLLFYMPPYKLNMWVSGCQRVELVLTITPMAPGIHTGYICLFCSLVLICVSHMSCNNLVKECKAIRILIQIHWCLRIILCHKS